MTTWKTKIGCGPGRLAEEENDGTDVGSENGSPVI